MVANCDLLKNKWWGATPPYISHCKYEETNGKIILSEALKNKLMAMKLAEYKMNRKELIT